MNIKLFASEQDADESPFDEDAEAAHLERISEDDDGEEADISHEDDEEEEQARVDGRRPANAKDANDDDDDGDDGDEDDDGEGGQKQRPGESKSAFQRRVDRLTARAKTAEEDRDNLQARLAEAERERDEARGFGANASLENIKAQEETVSRELADAIERGDTAKQIELQKKLGRVSAQLLAMENYQKRTQKGEGEGEKAQPRTEDRPAPTGRAAFKPEARPWYDRNKEWFDDPSRSVERAAVAAIDADLTREGYELSDSDRYDELDRRMKEKFPTLYRKGDSGRNRQQGRQRVAGVGHESTGAGRGDPDRGGGRTQALTNEDKRLMRTFKLDPANPEHVKNFRREQRAGRR